MDSQHPILIIGGGVIGLSIGWELARTGEAVTIFERDDAGRGASWAAGGMLAPDAEMGFEEPKLYALNRESLHRWPKFADQLEADTGYNLDFRTEGTLSVADDRDAFEAHGGTLYEHARVRAIEPDDETPPAVPESGDSIEGHLVILAAGAWSRQIEGLQDDHRPPVRPVKGQMVELQMELPFDLQHVIRGPDAYLIPKSDGRLLVGATSEEMGFDYDITAGGLYDLLEGAWEVVPGIRDLPVRDMWVGLRPASRDHVPLLGPSGEPGVIFATSHYRHGILLTPVTAQEIARLVREGIISDWIEPFHADRFAAVVGSWFPDASRRVLGAAWRIIFNNSGHAQRVPTIHSFNIAILLSLWVFLILRFARTHRTLFRVAWGLASPAGNWHAA